MIEPWEEISRAKVLITPWVQVIESNFKKPNRNEIDSHYLLDYPDWVNILAITPDGKVPLIRQYRPGSGQVGLELPCGGVEDGESAEQAARRELLEETGFIAQNWIRLGIISANPATHLNRNHCFLALDAQSVDNPKSDPNELIECEISDIQSVVQSALNGEVLQSLHLGAIFMSLPHICRISADVQSYFK